MSFVEHQINVSQSGVEANLISKYFLYFHVTKLTAPSIPYIYQYVSIGDTVSLNLHNFSGKKEPLFFWNFSNINGYIGRRASMK